MRHPQAPAEREKERESYVVKVVPRGSCEVKVVPRDSCVVNVVRGRTDIRRIRTHIERAIPGRGSVKALLRLY
jgi:hypothetical protein